MQTCPIRRVHVSRATMEGAGVRLHRAIGDGAPEEFDPFLLLDDFRSDHPREYEKGFPWHPHRGMETITYVLRGEVEHRDSLGHLDVIGPGDVQWMTSGSGILHQEMPRGDRSRSDVRVSALGKPSRGAQDDAAPLSRRAEP